MEAKTIIGLQVNSLNFSHHDAYNWGPKETHKPEHWTATAVLAAKGDKYDGLQNVTLEIGPEIASEIMRLLVPVMVQQASNAAQKLADQAKALTQEVGECCLMSLAAPKA